MNKKNRGGKRDPSRKEQIVSAADLQKQYGGIRTRQIPSEAFRENGTPRNGNGSDDKCDDHYSYKQNVVWTYLKRVDYRNKTQYVGKIETKDGRVFHVIPDFHGYIPTESDWYPCVVPRQKPLFLAREGSFIPKGEKVYTSKVLFAERTSLAVNGTEIVIIESSVSMPDALLMNGEVAVFFNGDSHCRIWIEDFRRRKVVQELSKAEKDTMGYENPWRKTGGGIIISPEYSFLKRDDVVEIVSGVFDKPLEEIFSENGKVDTRNGAKIITLGGM